MPYLLGEALCSLNTSLSFSPWALGNPLLYFLSLWVFHSHLDPSWLASFSQIVSKTTHAVEHARTFYIWTLLPYMHGSHFACQGFFLMGVLAASSPWLLWVALLGIWLCTYLNHREFDLIDIWSRSNAEAKMLKLQLKVAFDLTLDTLAELAGTPPYTFLHLSWSLPCPELYCLAHISVWIPQPYQAHTSSCLPNSGRFCTMELCAPDSALLTCHASPVQDSGIP